MDKRIIELLKDVIVALEKFVAAVEVEEAVEEPMVELEPVVEEPQPEPEPVVETPISEPVEESGKEPAEEIEEPVEFVEQAPVEEVEVDPTNIDVIVGEILEGKWGSGAKRKQNLEAAGYNYDEIQERVNQILNVVEEVLNGKWGNGDVRKQRLEEAGYNYKVIQDRINATIASRTSVQDDICAWAKKIADSKKYTYKNWKSSDVKTHQCPLCHPGSGNGWNCIGFSFASWHHGGDIPCYCNCGVIGNDGWEKLLTTNYADALAYAQKYIGIKEVMVVRNSSGIATNKLKKGDIINFFNGSTYQHTALYIGNSLMADSSGSNSGKYVTYGKKLRSGLKVAVRWTGDAKKKSIDTLAKEVLNGDWGSGEARRLNLLAAGCDYDAIQKRVNELV